MLHKTDFLKGTSEGHFHKELNRNNLQECVYKTFKKSSNRAVNKGRNPNTLLSVMDPS